jgi:hypothetical protein
MASTVPDATRDLMVRSHRTRPCVSNRADRGKAAVLHRLLDDLLPALDPDVFPRRDRTAWHDEDAYQVIQVQDTR